MCLISPQIPAHAGAITSRVASSVKQSPSAPQWPERFSCARSSAVQRNRRVQPPHCARDVRREGGTRWPTMSGDQQSGYILTT